MKITKETIRRAARTALQAALSFIGGQLMLGVDFTDWKTWATTVGAGAIGAALGALMNLEGADCDDEEMASKD